MVDWSLILTVGVQLVTVGIVFGMLKTDVNVLQRDLIRIEKEVTDSRSLREDIAVVKSQLAAIQTCLSNLSRTYHKDHNKEESA